MTHKSQTVHYFCVLNCTHGKRAELQSSILQVEHFGNRLRWKLCMKLIIQYVAAAVVIIIIIITILIIVIRGLGVGVTTRP